jgi:hypothetical protein
VIAQSDCDYALDRSALLAMELGELEHLLHSCGAEIISATRPHRTSTFHVVLRSANGVRHDGFGPTLISAIVEAVLATEADRGLELEARGAA